MLKKPSRNIACSFTLADKGHLPLYFVLRLGHSTDTLMTDEREELRRTGEIAFESVSIRINPSHQFEEK